ncbi:MAG: ABC transporter ATP-binding protein [Bauldia sp.]|nr:ABC transporter ATP-binding protein [Bauldia sp.]
MLHKPEDVAGSRPTSTATAASLGLAHASRVAGFFIRKAVRKFRWSFAATAALSIGSVGAQLGFLAFLERVLSRMTASEGQVTGLIALAIGLLAAGGVANLLLQWIVARMMVRNHRGLMRDIFRRLVADDSAAVGGNVAGVANLFTKDSRYGAQIGYRSARLVRPLIAVPALLAFCLWLAPLLTAIALATFVALAPAHAVLARRGVANMRSLRGATGAHSQSKKSLLQTLTRFPTREGLDFGRIEAEVVDAGSEAYLGAYFRRLMLSAWSTFLNFIAVAVGLGIVLLVLAGSSMDWTIQELLIFVLALRFLATSVGQIITDGTMIVSYAPLCEELYAMLSGKAASDDVPDGVIALDQAVPGAVIFAQRTLGPAGWQTALAAATGDTAWRSAVFARGQYPAHFRDLRRDLLLDQLPAGRELALPPAEAKALDRALRRQETEGWSQRLWDTLPDAVRFHATLQAGLVAGAGAVVLIGLVPAPLPEVEAMLAKLGLPVLQVLEAAPRRSVLRAGMAAYFFDGAQFLSLGPVEPTDRYVAMIQALFRDEPAGLFGDLDDPDEIDEA